MLPADICASFMFSSARVTNPSVWRLPYSEDGIQTAVCLLLAFIYHTVEPTLNDGPYCVVSYRQAIGAACIRPLLGHSQLVSCRSSETRYSAYLLTWELQNLWISTHKNTSPDLHALMRPASDVVCSKVYTYMLWWDRLLMWSVVRCILTCSDETGFWCGLW